MEHVLGILMITLLSAGAAAVLQNQAPVPERRIILASWLMHFCFTWANLGLVLYYYGTGDMLSFQENGLILADMILADPFNVFPEVVKLILQMDYVLAFNVPGSGSTDTIVGFTALFTIFLQGSLPAMSLLMSMASFVGKVFLLTAIRDFFPRNMRVGVAICVMLVPSAVFWTSGLIKESFAFTAMGVAALGMHLVRRRPYVGVPILAVGVLFVALIKAYILMVGAIALGAWWYWDRSVQRGRVEIKPVHFVLGLAAGVVGVYLVGEIFPRFNVANLADEALSLQEHGHRGGSKFSLGMTDTSGTGFFVMAPLAVLTGLFRPALFDVRNPQMLANALESTVLLVMIARGMVRLQYQGMIRLAVRYPILVFCVLFSLGLALGVGFATANLGTLSRYRMPLMPFLAIFAYASTRKGAAATVRSAARRVAAPRVSARRAPPVAARLS